tara:strand:- start:79 stop:1095 length:1017 start_codon:yes stop_codon:yes gene_type:complete
MEYVNFGNSGVKVSRIALGLGLRGEGDAAKAERLIKSTIDLGVNLIDCANVYGLLDERINSGTSEKILGKVIKSCRDDVVITSKVTSPIGELPNDSGSSRLHIMREVERSLKRLNTDHIDVYILHAPDHTTPLEEIIRAMDDLVRAGKILYPGCSNYKAWQIYRALSISEKTNAAPFIIMQNPYSLMNRQVEQEHFSLAKHTGVGIMAYSPLGIGLLSGKYDSKSNPFKGSLWNKPERSDYYLNLMKGRTAKLIETVRDIAENHSATPAQIALSWVLSHSEISVAISGADSEEQIKENVQATEITLTENELNDLNNDSIGLSYVLDGDPEELWELPIY